MLLSRAGHDLFKVGHALYKVVHYCCRGHRNSGGWKQRAGGQRFSRQRPEAGACRHCWNRGGADLGALVFYSCIVLMLCPLILHLCTVSWCSSCRGFDCPPVCGAGSCRGAGDPRWGGGVCGSQGKGPPHAQASPRAATIGTPCIAHYSYLTNPEWSTFTRRAEAAWRQLAEGAAG